MKREIKIQQESWPLRNVFRISRGSRTEIGLVTVEIRAGEHCGRGECSPNARYNETLDSVNAEIEQLLPALERGLAREQLADHLSHGAARNAVDCALWDLAAKQASQSVWELAGLTAPKAVTSAFTLSIDEPDNMALAAEHNADRPLLKLKLAGDGHDLDRVTAVRTHAPESDIIVDANESWQRHDYEKLVPEFEHLRVALIEQPFTADADDLLAELPRPIPVCADESCHDRESLPALSGRYDVINIKLDKTGGLSEALALREAALAQGFEIMVGCMLGTSLAMAPALLVAQGARFADLDGPLLLAKDRQPALQINGSILQPSESALWG